MYRCKIILQILTVSSIFITLVLIKDRVQGEWLEYASAAWINNSVLVLFDQITSKQIQPGHGLEPPSASFSCNKWSSMNESKIVRTNSMSYTFQSLPDKPAPAYISTYKNPCWIETFHKPKKISNTTGFAEEILMCVPRIFIAGVVKGGSTDIWKQLMKHPYVRGGYNGRGLQEKNKELGYWEHLYHSKTLYQYADMYKSSSEELQNACMNTTETMHDHIQLVDGTPNLFHSYSTDIHRYNSKSKEPNVTPAQLIHRIIPQAKFLIIFRDPVRRLWSDYLYFHKRKPTDHANSDKFHNMAVRSLQHYRNCFKQHTLRACAYNKKLKNESTGLRVDIGLYHIFLRDWMAAIPHDQLYITKLEQYSQNKVAEMKKVFKFFDLDEPPASIYMDIDKPNIANERSKIAKKVGDMHPKTKDILREFYSEHNRKLVELLNDESMGWGY